MNAKRIEQKQVFTEKKNILRLKLIDYLNTEWGNRNFYKKKLWVKD